MSVLGSTSRPPRAARSHSRRRPSLTICGGGNGAHALAVVASQNIDVEIDWLVGSEERAELLRRGSSGGGPRSTGAITASADRLRTISADPAEVIPAAGMILIVVPAFAHAAILRRIAPHVAPGAAIGCLPTRGGFEFDATSLLAGHTRVPPTIFGLQTLPWSTRVTAAGESVHIGAVKQEVVVAALPANRGPGIAEQLSRMLGTRVVASGGFLGLTLGNPGQSIHSGLMYGHFHSWDGEPYGESDVPLLYAQASDEIGAVVEALSAEACDVAREIDAQSGGRFDLTGAVVPIHDWLRTSYANVTADTHSVASCFRTGPIQARKAPMIEVAPGRYVPNFAYRYVSEDVPFGLVATRALAALADVETPMIDEVISWGQSVLGTRYLVGSELSGPDALPLPLPQNHGISTLEDLIDWYGVGDHAPTVAVGLGAS
jgi:hypothetical protein